MNIKRVIQFSFTFIIALILIITLINVTTIKKIESNSEFKNLISRLMKIQEEMNVTILQSIKQTSSKSLLKSKKSFEEKEKKFKTLKDTFVSQKSENFFDDLILDILKQNEVKEHLNILYNNKNEITKKYIDFQNLKKDRLKVSRKLSSSKRKEKKLLELIQRKVLSLANINLISEFTNIKYLAKDTIEQYRNKDSLKKFITYSLSFYEQTQIKEITSYQTAVKNLRVNIYKYNQIKRDEIRLINDLNKLIIKNKNINLTITTEIKNVHATILKDNNLMLFTISSLTILFMIFLAIKVSRNVGLSVDEIHRKVHKGTKEIESLNHEIEATQREVIFTMGAIGENRSKETGNHVKRVAEYSKLLALYYGLDKNIAEMLKQASPMHDIGKIAIPDAVLNKPGRFDENERKIMDKHAKLGYDMLKHSSRPLLQMAATVAHEHHEKWDGTGYPNKLKGEEIHIYGRITALADVFDALGSDRVYKKAWDDEKIFKLFKEERAKHFDPKLIDIFFKHLDEFLTIREKFKDKI